MAAYLLLFYFLGSNSNPAANAGQGTASKFKTLICIGHELQDRCFEAQSVEKNLKVLFEKELLKSSQKFCFRFFISCLILEIFD